MGRSPCCSKEAVNRGAWTETEDKILTDYIKVHGEGKWRNLPKKAGLNRCGKSCRLRWLNYLRPDIKRGNITDDEEELIIRLHRLLGNRWALIAGRLPGRTDNEIKNYWNTKIGKKFQSQLKHHHRHHHQEIPSSNCSPKFDQHQENHPNPKIQTSIAQQPSTLNFTNSSSVIQARASRCTKAVVANEPLEHNCDKHQLEDYGSTVAPPASSSLPESLSEFESPENVPEGLMMDFEMDEQLLLDLLDTDFSQLTKCDDGSASDPNYNTICEQQVSLSPNADRTHLSSDDNALQDSDFRLMGSSIEPELDCWLRD